MAPMTGVVIRDWSAETASVSGKTVLVVGGTSGLGRAIARKAAVDGAAKVTVVGRTFRKDENKSKGDADATAMEAVEFVPADLSSMKGAKTLGETVEPADIVVLTCGIVPKNTRETSPEDGIEMDLAVSFLSRLVLLKYLVPRLQPKSRVFIMGFPGSNIAKIQPLDDLNSEKTYSGGFGAVHMTTVAGNEALVLDYANNKKPQNEIRFYGLNPGMIKTGIRSNAYEGNWLMKNLIGPLAEGLINLVSDSPDSYAAKIVPLLGATNLDEHNGAMFNPKAQPVQASEYLTKDDLAAKLIAASEALVKEKTGIALP